MSEKEKKVKELSAEEVLQKFDKESDKRELTGVWGKIISAICILFALFQLYTATFGVLGCASAARYSLSLRLFIDFSAVSQQTFLVPQQDASL